ncbi:histidine kinase [Kineosporia sp. NBRC 101731]|uniref:sensor histidine kinase n=1 Tax=Kineosporia sp. NBRC 101731 TaxID=3032199 RepID=UPI0024A5585C|nr:histidine kinase [Kineosporia sp. NBRC 101731]GLY33346.1 two-component sensor histidine kinase [Kineosporia sp. NBRC 101731]
MTTSAAPFLERAATGIATGLPGLADRFHLGPRRRALLLDLPLVIGTTGIEIGLLSDSLGAPGTPPPGFTLALTGCAGLLLLLHRRAPLVMLALILTLEAVLAAANSYPGGAPALVAMGLVALYRERRRALPALAVTALVLQIGSISAIPVPVIAWAVGANTRSYLRYLATLEDRNQQIARLAAQTERTAIARELHDIVAHSVTVMLLGVRGARDTLRADPDLAEEALRQVERSGEQSIAELRQMLVVLREDGPGASSGLAPAPSIAQLPALVEQHRRTGTPVTLLTVGEPGNYSAATELTVYRVVQEGLTNAARHADAPGTVAVTLTFGERRLEVSVTDDGRPRPPAPSPGTGSGIPGLRERVAAAGGHLEAGPTAAGFRLAAVLPPEPEPTRTGARRT